MKKYAYENQEKTNPSSNQKNLNPPFPQKKRSIKSMSSNTNYMNTNFNTPQALNNIDPLPASIPTPFSNQKYDEDDIYNEILKQALLKKYQKINQRNNVNVNKVNSNSNCQSNHNINSNNNNNNISPNMFKLKSISSSNSRQNKKNVSALSKSYNNQNKNIYDETENNNIINNNNVNSYNNKKKFSSDRIKGFSNNDLNNYYKGPSNTANNCVKYKKIYKDNICGSGDMGRGNCNINLNGIFGNNGINGFSDRYGSRPKTRKSFDYNILGNSNSNYNNSNNNVNLINNNLNNNDNDSNSNNCNNIIRKFNKYYQGNQFNLYNKNNIKVNNNNNDYVNTDVNNNTNNTNSNNLNQRNKYKNLVIYNPLQIYNSTNESNPSNQNEIEDNQSYRNNKTTGNYIENHNHYLDSNRKNNKTGMSFDKYCAILQHKIEVLKFDIAKYKKDKYNLVQFINDNIDMKAVNTINKLESEINGYKNAVLKYKKNCEDLTKEIVVIQHQINKFKNSK